MIMQNMQESQVTGNKSKYQKVHACRSGLGGMLIVAVMQCDEILAVYKTIFQF